MGANRTTTRLGVPALARAFLSIFFLLLVIIVPWWLSLLTALILMAFIPRYYEIFFAGLIFDAQFGGAHQVLLPLPFLGLITATFLFMLSFFINRNMLLR